MITLRSLLLEALSNKPIAIFMAGSAGAGKSTFRKKYIDAIGNFEVINIDDEYEPLLAKANLPLDFRQYKSPEQLSTAASAMASAQKITRDKYQSSKSKLTNLIIDGTGASYREVVKKKAELEQLGYKTAMVLVFVTPDISLFRNIKRGDAGGRTLMPSIILRTWSSLFQNIDSYKNLFGENLILFKAYKDEDVKFPNFDPDDPEIRKMFFEPFKVRGKEKTEKEKQDSAEKIRALNQQIRDQYKKLSDIDFDDPSEIASKLNNLVNA